MDCRSWGEKKKKNFFFFFFNDTATTEIYTLSLHDALPISSFLGQSIASGDRLLSKSDKSGRNGPFASVRAWGGSEEHTSELQS